MIICGPLFSHRIPNELRVGLVLLPVILMKNILVTRQSPVWSCSPPNIFSSNGSFLFSFEAAVLLISLSLSRSSLWINYRRFTKFHLVNGAKRHQKYPKLTPLEPSIIYCSGFEWWHSDETSEDCQRSTSAHFMARLLLKWNWCFINNFRVTNIHPTITAVQWYSFGISQFHFCVLFIRKWLKK